MTPRILRHRKASLSKSIVELRLDPRDELKIFFAVTSIWTLMRTESSYLVQFLEPREIIFLVLFTQHRHAEYGLKMLPIGHLPKDLVEVDQIKVRFFWRSLCSGRHLLFLV